MTSPSTATPTRLTARTPEDLLAVAPVVLGFWPAHSVVMLTFGSEHPFHARVDLPDDPDDTAAMPELAAMLSDPAAHHRVERVVLLLYADDAALADAAWRALRTAFARRRITVVEALRVGEGRWFPLLAGDPTAREVGVPYDPGQIASHPFLTQAVLDGRVTHGSRDDLAATLEPSSAGVAAVASLVASRTPLDPSDASALLAEGTWAHALVLRHVEAQSRVSDVEAARLLVAMRSLRVRDAAWSAITRARSRSAMGFFTDLVQRTPGDLLPAAAALLAWSAWQAGDGALAWCAIDRCSAVDPGYGLTGLVAEALERAVPPTVWDDGFDWKEGLDTA